MITKIQKWGNSLGLRIPKALARDAQVQEGARVDLTVKNGCLLVVPTRSNTCDLDSLLAQVSPSNLHAEVDFS